MIKELLQVKETKCISTETVVCALSDDFHPIDLPSPEVDRLIQ